MLPAEKESTEAVLECEIPKFCSDQKITALIIWMVVLFRLSEKKVPLYC